MLKKFFTLLLLTTLGLVFFIQPGSIFADDEVTNLTELVSETAPTTTSQTESSEGGGDQSGSEFDTSNYKTYNNRGFDDDEFDDKYFYTPLKKVTKVNGEFPPGQTGTDPTQVYKDIREELAKTGYEAYCMVENVKIDPKYNTGKLIDIYLEYHPNGTNLPTVSTEILATDNAEYPIWRDVDDKQFLMTSLEEYFGFKDVIEKDPAISEINTAPINSLLSQKQACVQGWESLASQRRACNKLEENKECALTKRRVPGTGYETHDLMGMTAKFYDDHIGKSNWAKIVVESNKGESYDYGTNLKCATSCSGTCHGSICETDYPSVEGCEILFADPKNAEKELNSVEKSLRDSIINVPTYHDQSYRLGFIIAAIETRYPAVTNPSATKADIIFNFFTPKTQNMKVDEVLVTAFKLPDIGTNKGPKSNWGHEEWNDPLDLTRMALTTKATQEIHDEERQDKRAFVLSAAESAVKQTEDSRIYCIPEDKKKATNNGAGLLPGPGTNTCLVPLPRALVDIVNGNVTNESCENKTETVDFISDLAGLRSPSDFYGKEFKSEFGGQVLLNLFFGSVYNTNGESPGYAEVDFDSIWSINKDTWKPTTPNSLVHFYLVYPMGFELGTVEEAIKGTFFSTEQIANMNEDKSIVNVFEMTGQAQTLNGGKVGWKYKDKDWKLNNEGDCEYETNPITGFTNYNKPIVCTEKPSIKIVQDGGKVDILGGKLSWWLRKVQVSLSSTAGFAHSYYQSCKTMEEFLLGKCEGGVTGGDSGNNSDSICEVAKEYNLDCDFLKAIYAIETNSGEYLLDSQNKKTFTDPEDGTINTYNCCNSEGYCGPMQVSGFHTHSISKGLTEDLNICDSEDKSMDAFIAAARWILIKKWCTSNIGLCYAAGWQYDDWRDSYIETQGDSKITTKKEVESFVLGWYGSDNLVETEIIEWPPGATYTDAVMACMGMQNTFSGDWSTWLAGGGKECPVNK